MDLFKYRAPFRSPNTTESSFRRYTPHVSQKATTAFKNLHLNGLRTTQLLIVIPVISIRSQDNSSENPSGPINNSNYA